MNQKKFGIFEASKARKPTNQLPRYDNSFENQSHLLPIIGETKQPYLRNQQNSLRPFHPSRTTEELIWV